MRFSGIVIGSALVMTVHADDALNALHRSNEGLRRFVLDNGMVCLVKKDASAPVSAIQIWLGTGAVHEEENLGGGLSHYMEHMIFKGTARRGPTDITREIDEAGGDINAYTANDRTVFHVELPSRNWEVALDVLADAVMNASLPEDEWAREKDVILREFAMGYDDPDRVLNKLLWATAFRIHPYRFPVIGYEEIFRTMTRDQLVAFKQRHYTPDNMIVAVVGDVDPDQVETRLRDTFKDFARRARAPIVLPAEPPQLSPRFARQTGDYNISRLQWAYPSVPLSHPDAPALDVLAAVIGSGRSSRLNEELKERRALVFDVDAWSYTPKDPGLFGISASFAPSNETAVLQAIQEQIDRWIADGFTADEVAKAKRMILVGELGSLATMSGQASSYASGEFYAYDPRYAETYVRLLDGITPDSLRDVVRRYLRPEARTLVLLTPPETPATDAGPVAESAGNVEKLVLSNGVTLLVREDHRLPFVHLCAALTGGLLSEDEKNNGVTQLMGELLTRGANGRSAEAIARDIESRGASLSSFAGRNSFGLQAAGLSEDTDFIARMLADALLRPDFPAEELEKQRVVQIADIEQQREKPMFLAQEQLRGLLFSGHPYRFTPSGTRESVGRLTRDDVVAQHRAFLKSGNLVLAFFGDISPAKARAIVESNFSELPAGATPSITPRAPDPELPVTRTRREPRQQAIVLLGFPGIDLKDPRMDALNVLARALSGLSSDLGIEIREKRGLVYYVGAFNQPGLAPGLFALYAGTRADAAAEVERLMREQVERIAREGLRDEEWQRARSQLLAANDMSLQNNGELAQVCALNELYGLGYRYSFDLPDRLAALTGDSIREAAASILKSEREAVSIVLPEEKKP